MAKLNTEADLRDAILLLEIKQEGERQLLNEEFHKVYENIQPINLIKNAVEHAVQSSEFKGNLINAGLGLATGYATKLLFQGAMHSQFRKILGTAVMFGVTKAITKNPKVVNSMATGLLNLLNSVKRKT
jgi:hypothetical protein